MHLVSGFPIQVLVVATADGAYRVVDVVVSPPGYPIEAIVKVRPVRFSVVSR